MPFSFFKWSRSERLALLILVLLLLIAGGVYLFMPRSVGFSLVTAYDNDTLPPPWDGSRGARFVHQNAERSRSSRSSLPTHSSSDTLFAFDPNRCDSLQLLRLGLSPFLVRNVMKYRRAGGVFRTRAAFGKLYGLSPEKYRELHPYLQLPDTLPTREPRFDPSPSPRHAVVKLQRGQTLELNSADTSLLKQLPGIGSGYARMIVAYRRRLGGFVSVDQLREVERLPDSVVVQAMDYLTLSSDSIQPINLNVASIERMQAHPYLDFYQAKAIVEYRRQHGTIRSLNVFRLYDEFTADDLRRLQPYVVY